MWSLCCKVAVVVGIRSLRTFDPIKAVIKKANELKGEGKSDDSALFVTWQSEQISLSSL